MLLRSSASVFAGVDRCVTGRASGTMDVGTGVNLDPRLLLLSIPSGVCLAVTALRWRHHLRQGERADAATPVSGVVVADGDEPVVELEIDLKIPYSSTGMSVEETHRELRVRPFMLKTDGGELIDVDPPREVQLHATLGKAQKLEHLKRYKKAAQARVGQRVYLLGQVHDARSPDDGPFREGERQHRHISPDLVSTERIGSTARRAAANDRRWLVRWAVMTVLGPLPYLMPIVPLFVLAFWIRDMIVSQMWWEKKRYSEWYGTGTTREDRAEYH